MNFPLFSMLWSMSATVLIGIFIIIILVMQYDGFNHIYIAVAAGAIISIPVAWVLAKKMSSNTNQ